MYIIGNESRVWYPGVHIISVWGLTVCHSHGKSAEKLLDAWDKNKTCTIQSIRVNDYVCQK